MEPIVIEKKPFTVRKVIEKTTYQVCETVIFAESEELAVKEYNDSKQKSEYCTKEQVRSLKETITVEVEKLETVS